MLNAVIAWSIRRRHAVLISTLGIVLLGLFALAHLPIDAFPDTTPVQVQINTTAPALAPLEVERQITSLVEQAISGLPRLKEVRSSSKFGLSQVTVIFDDGADIYRARQTVMERLQSVNLPAGIERPQLGPVATGLGEVFHYLVTGPGKSLAEVRAVQDWIIKPQMRSVPGVAEVNTWGGDERQIHVVVDPATLAARGLTLDELVVALERNNANVGGGALDQSGQSSLVQGLAAVTRPEEVGEIVVAAREGVPIYVRDVARIQEGREIRRGAVTADGRSEVVLGLGFMLMGENSHDVTNRLKVRLEEVKKSLPAGITVETVYDRTHLVERVLHTVVENLFLGAVLVVAILFGFLGNWRAGLIVASAIPLSMLFAFDLMVRAGVAGTLMSLGAIDFGLIVDSSVIMVENSVRRLGEDTSGRSQPEVVQEAAIEVRRPTMFGELIIMVVYLPILALEGVEGKLFRPMALTVIFALLGSLILSLTLMPALCATFLKRRHEPEVSLVRKLRGWYRPALNWALARPRPILVVAAVLVLGASLLATRLGSEFVPRLQEGAIVINTVRLAGVSVDESARYGLHIERVILEKFPSEVERVWSRTGTAEVATDPMGTEVTDVFVTLKPRGQWTRAKTQDELVLQLEKELSIMPAMRMIFTQPIEMRVNEMVAGVRSDIAIKLFGDDFDMLKAKAREIESTVRALPGAADVLAEQVTGLPVVQVEVDRTAIARHGIPAREVLDAVEALGRREVGFMQEGERRFPIAVTLEERLRNDPVAIGSILVTSAGGDRIPLGQLARIRTVEGPSTINREWAKRRIVVQANVRGRDVGGFVADVRKAIAERVQLPPGYYVQYGGQFEHLQRAQARLAIVVPMALALILLLLYLSYRRASDVMRVFLAVPFAVVGGVVALWLRGLPFSIAAAVGFIALSGVAVLNSLVLVSTIRQNLAAGLSRGEAITQAAERRLRPVLMTALVASAGFIPMAVNTGIGAEVQRPLATVVIGGVLSSTLLTLFVLPVLYGMRRQHVRASGDSPGGEPLSAASSVRLDPSSGNRISSLAPTITTEPPTRFEDPRAMIGKELRAYPSYLSSFLAAVLFLSGGLVVPSPAKADSKPPEVLNAAELQLALGKLRVLGSVLYVAAHPDDENTSLITYLSKGRGLRVGYLSMTRGSGGQNLIGSETGDALGVIRTQELLAARGVDGAEQFFTRAVDFGYSKTADETMAIWGRDKILSDIVWVIRNFRPDVIVTRFPTDTRGGHGHHQASAILAREAFAAAADPKRFPEQLQTVKPWRAKRILWNVFRLDPAPRDPKLPPLLTVDVGRYSPLLGHSYTEISAASRSMHKSQGFGAAERRGPMPNYFELLDGEPVRPESGSTQDLLEGVTIDWSRITGGGQVDAILAEAERAFEPEAPDRVLPVLARARAAMRPLGGDPWVILKMRELDEAMRACAGLWLEAIAQQPFALPGGTVPVNVSILNRSGASVTVAAIKMPNGAALRSVADSNATFRDRILQPHASLDGVATVTLPARSDITHPFWLRSRSSEGAHDVPAPALRLRAENPPALTVEINLVIAGERIEYDVPVLYRWTDRVAGERYRPLEVSPPVSLRFERDAYLFADGSPREVRVVLESPGGAVTGPVRLDLPRGWRATPAETTVTVNGPDAPTSIRFWVRPGAGEASSALAMTASMATGASRQARSRTTIDYPHIPVTTLFPEAEARLVRADVKRSGTRVGYVMGSGDDVPSALEQMGFQVTLLSDEDIESTSLATYDAIVTGIRSYNTRPRLRALQGRLLDYVSDGGTLVVQYNTAEDVLRDKLGPYPFTISRDRVTVEGSPVRFSLPEHRLLTAPNRIGPADFEGWVQERGLYFANPWDSKFEAPLSMNDPGEPANGGSLLVTRYGKGTFIYTGISWFRQLPAGVPGAYRLFANLVGGGKE